jgi:hypothetical protein
VLYLFAVCCKYVLLFSFLFYDISRHNSFLCKLPFYLSIGRIILFDTLFPSVSDETDFYRYNYYNNDYYYYRTINLSQDQINLTVGSYLSENTLHFKDETLNGINVVEPTSLTKRTEVQVV